jgi:hypothetical protein
MKLASHPTAKITRFKIPLALGNPGTPNSLSISLTKEYNLHILPTSWRRCENDGVPAEKRFVEEQPDICNLVM